jgi:hypothetical protein
MPDLDANPIHRGTYLSLMLGAIVLAVGLAAAIVRVMNGPGTTAWWAAAAVAVGSLPTLLPGILRVRPSNWGLVVFAGSTTRMLLVLSIGYAIMNGQGVDRRSFWFAVLCGAVLILVVESAAAVSMLARRERERHVGTPTGAAPGAFSRTTA